MQLHKSIFKKVKQETYESRICKFQFIIMSILVNYDIFIILINYSTAKRYLRQRHFVI